MLSIVRVGCDKQMNCPISKGTPFGTNFSAQKRMNPSDAKIMLTAIESELPNKPFVIANTFERNGRKLHLGITDRLRRAAKRGRVWKANAFLTALKNAEYGFDESKARSLGGSDGIFLLDRDFAPRNEMMRKIFDRFLDKETEQIEAIARAECSDRSTPCGAFSVASIETARAFTSGRRKRLVDFG